MVEVYLLPDADAAWCDGGAGDSSAGSSSGGGGGGGAGRERGGGEADAASAASAAALLAQLAPQDVEPTQYQVGQGRGRPCTNCGAG